MTPFAFIVAISFSAALASGSILIPLAKFIPLRMMKEFRELVIENGHQPASPLLESDYRFSLLDKVGICIAGGLIGLLTASIYPDTTGMLANGGYLLGILLLVAINLKHQLLPDQVVFVLLWVGLLRGVATTHGADYVLGAAVGYGAPLFLLLAVKAATGKWFLGYGDLKALAMAGAWFGVAALPLIFATFAGATILTVVIDAVLQRSRPAPTGPAHLAASLACVFSPAGLLY